MTKIPLTLGVQWERLGWDRGGRVRGVRADTLLEAAGKFGLEPESYGEP